MNIKFIPNRFLLRLLLNKRYLLLKLGVSIFVTLALYKLTVSNLPLVEIKEEFMNTDKLVESNEPIRACRLPQLLIDDPLIRKYFIQEKPLKCAKEKNWIYVDNGKFFISDLANRTHGRIQCDLNYIERIDDNHYSYTKYENVENNTALIGGMFKATCMGEDGANYDNLHLGVPVPQDQIEKGSSNSRGKGRKKSNVLIYILDSVSRMHFIRKLPNFYKFLNEELKGFLFEGFNIVGDSTTAALIPMTTGHFQQELPEARKRHENATKMDNWPFIFKEYSAHHYVTSYAEEQVWMNAFHMRLIGFDEPPVDNFMRAFLIALEHQKSHQLPYCLGDTPESIVWLEYFRQLQIVLGPLDKSHFSIFFTSETSHDHYNKVQVLDEHLTNRFHDLLKNGYLDDTFVFVMSDHGHRHVITRVTQTGKWEERLPFLFIRPPVGFCDRYGSICENMKSNQDALVTAFDIHATLQNILHLNDHVQNETDADLSQRGISVFKRIPHERTCAHAAISAHFCSCLEWEEIDNAQNDKLVLGAARYVLEKFNEKSTLDVGDTCANLTLLKVLSARQLQPNDKLLAFKESLDYDNFFPDLSDNSSIAAVIYQVHFTSEPGSGDWEVSVTYFTQLQRYAMSMDSVSRLNKYGEQARCVIDEYPHLRMFCYCLRDKV